MTIIIYVDYERVIRQRNLQRVNLSCLQHYMTHLFSSTSWSRLNFLEKRFNFLLLDEVHNNRIYQTHVVLNCHVFVLFNFQYFIFIFIFTVSMDQSCLVGP